VPIGRRGGHGRWLQRALTTAGDSGSPALEPGSYLVRTSAKRLEDGQDLIPTYYPGAASAAEARKVEVELDEEADSVTVAPLIGELAEVTGRFGANGTVLLISEYSLRESISQLGSHFRFESVEPGDYSLIAVSANGLYAGYEELSVSDSDKEVNLKMSTMPELHLGCEIFSDSQREVEGASFFFRRADIADDNPKPLSCGEYATFPPGRWQVAAVPPADLYVAAILEGGTASRIQDLLLKPGESRELRIAFGSSPSTLSGEVRTPEGEVAVGAPVYLRAIGADLQRRVGGVREARTGSDGIYRILALPPGEYEVLSSFQLQDPESDLWPTGFSVFVNLAEGESEDLDLTLTTIR